MKKLALFATFAIGILTCPLLVAQSPGTPVRPPTATGICKDGTFSTAASKSGACRGHRGIQQWYASTTATPAAPSAPAATPTPAAPPPPAAAPSTTTQARTQSQAAAQNAAQSNTPPATQSLKKGPAANAANMPLTPGGGPGLVWVNTASNVYHCPGTTYYGKTKQGSYMSEAAAKAKGAHGDHGQSCSK